LADLTVRQANQCLLKVAHLAAELHDFEKAIQIFEKVAAASVDNNLTKWSAREYLFKAGLCILSLNVCLLSIFK
jgi:alpha-soluble NSF attachment protein